MTIGRLRSSRPLPCHGYEINYLRTFSPETKDLRAGDLDSIWTPSFDVDPTAEPAVVLHMPRARSLGTFEFSVARKIGAAYTYRRFRWHRAGDQRSEAGRIGRTRIRSRVTTQKFPLRSGCDFTSAKATSAASSGDSGMSRNRTTPLPAESPRRKTSSPKSLSKVKRIRWPSEQRPATSSSAMPGHSSATENISQPALRSASRAGRGKFSSAKNLMRSSADRLFLRAGDCRRRRGRP